MTISSENCGNMSMVHTACPHFSVEKFVYIALICCIICKHELSTVVCVLSCPAAGVCGASNAGGMWCELCHLSLCPDACSYCCLRGSSSVPALAAAGRSRYKQTGKTFLLNYTRDGCNFWGYFDLKWLLSRAATELIYMWKFWMANYIGDGPEKWTWVGELVLRGWF